MKTTLAAVGTRNPEDDVLAMAGKPHPHDARLLYTGTHLVGVRDRGCWSYFVHSAP